MPISFNDVMEEAMIEIGVLAIGEPIPASRSAFVQRKVADMLESWSLDGLMVVADVLESFTLTAGQEEYTYGAAGDFASARPIEIRDDSFMRVSDFDYPVRVLTLDVYRLRRNKQLSSRPRIMAYSPEYPLGKVFVWPSPSTADDLHLRVRKQITQFADRTTEVDFDPGYQRAIIKGLALEIAGAFGKSISQSLAATVTEAVALIRAKNVAPITPMRTPQLARMAGGRGVHRNINTGPG